MTVYRLAWVTDPDAAYHLTDSDARTVLKTLCGRSGYLYTMGDNERIWNASCLQCQKKSK